MQVKAGSIIYFLFSFFSICLCSCEGKGGEIITPTKFINRIVVNRDDYVKDSLLLCKLLSVDLLSHERFFNNAAYFELTEIIVDTIIYYPDFKKMAAFVIVKNPTYRQLYPDEKHKWYYEGTCYLGEKIGDSLLLSWIGPSFTNSVNKGELSEILEDYYYTEFATFDTTTPHACKYNLNDVRFKDCKLWKN